MKAEPVINLAVLNHVVGLNYSEDHSKCYEFLYNNNVSLSAICDAIHFATYPLDKPRPEIMISIGRGLEKVSAYSRVDEASIVLGYHHEIDYPDLCNVYVESAKCKISGEELTEEQLDELSDDHELKMSILL